MSSQHAVPGGRQRPLSPAELRVVELIAEDRPYKEIAEILSVTIQTVKNHADNARNKLGIRSQVGLALWHIKQNGWTRLEH